MDRQPDRKLARVSSATPFDGESITRPQNPTETDLFSNLWNEYGRSNRMVAVEEILDFIWGANCTREELSVVRKAIQLRRKVPRRPGRPRVSKSILSPNLAGAEQMDEADFINDPHEEFRSACMIAGDWLHLRPYFLSQIEGFVGAANSQELRVIGKAVADRAKSKSIRKRRGRPRFSDDNDLMARARIVAWMRIVEGKSDDQIARALEIPTTRRVPYYDGRSGDLGDREIHRPDLRWTLQRIEDALAAKIWGAIWPNYAKVTLYEGEHRVELKTNLSKPNVLQHQPLLQFIWIRTGLPFKTHPEECKKIVETLVPQSLKAAAEYTDREFAYLSKRRKPNK